MSSALRSVPFRWVGSIYTADLLLEWIGSVALMVLVYGETDSTTAAAALLLAKQVVPGALIPLLGSTLDRLPVGRTLTFAFVTQAAFLFVIGTVGFGPVVFVLAAGSGLAGGTVRSLLRASVARSLQGDALTSGNAILNILVGLTGFAGPALGAGLIAADGVGFALLVVAVGLAVAGVIASRMPVGIGAPATEGEDESTGAEVPVVGNPSGLPLAGLLAVVAVVMCVFSMDEPALLAFSERSLGAGVGGYSAIIVAWGAGITLGSLVFTRLGHWSLLRVYVVATMVSAFAYIGMGLAPTIEVACAIAVIGGVGNGMDWVAVVTLVQRATPKGREAFAGTWLEAIMTAAPGLGILAGGLLADITSPRMSLVIPGGLALCVLLVSGVALRLSRSAHSAALPQRGAPSFSPSIHGGSA